LTEANVNGLYSSSQLTHTNGSLTYGLTLFEEIPVNYTAALTTPWRVAIIGDLPTIVTSTLVDDLSDSRFDGDFSWVRPGTSSWSWLTDSRSPSNETRQYDFVALAARNRWDYVLLDEGWDASWVPRVAANASAQNVSTLIWFHHDDLSDPSTWNNLLDQVKSWGVSGVKLDFMNSDSQATFQWYDDISRATFDRQLLVYYHGATIPHGLQRKWPHIMTYEAVRGAENGINIVRAMILPFTRNVVGSMDWTPGAFSRDNFQASYALQAGLCIIYESGIQHISDNPENYAAQPEINDFLVGLPSVWDETVLINGTPASHVVIGRRAGDRWFFGGGAVGRQELTLPLSTLGAGQKWLVNIVKDAIVEGSAVINAVDSSTQVLSSNDTVTVQTATNGGFAAVACSYNGQMSC
jgi:alpha-glucosidase